MCGADARAGTLTHCSLMHVLLLAAQNLFQLCFTETVYMAEDMPLALKTYLCRCTNNGFTQCFVGT